MARYFLYITVLLFLGAATVLYLTRNRWVHYLRWPGYIYSRIPSSFAADIEDGFTSATFDLSENLSSGDDRQGLDRSAKQQVKEIMRTRRVNFDEARRLYTEELFVNNGIGSDGRPRDPKFVSFS